MLHFHGTQKLLNVSKIKPVLYLDASSPGQQLHSWYTVLCGSGFTGKMLLLYVHQPSLMTVIVKGKTIGSTIDNFRKQLEHLMIRHGFPKLFIEKELLQAKDYVVGKTSNKSMLAHINQMVLQVTAYNFRYASYDEIDTIVHEDIFMDWWYKRKEEKEYQTPLSYWMKELSMHPPL